MFQFASGDAQDLALPRGQRSERATPAQPLTLKIPRDPRRPARGAAQLRARSTEAGVSGAICWGEDSGKPASPESVDGDSVGVGLAKRSVARSTPGWGAGSLRPFIVGTVEQRPFLKDAHRAMQSDAFAV